MQYDGIHTVVTGLASGFGIGKENGAKELLLVLRLVRIQISIHFAKTAEDADLWH